MQGKLGVERLNAGRGEERVAAFSCRHRAFFAGHHASNVLDHRAAPFAASSEAADGFE